MTIPGRLSVPGRRLDIEIYHNTKEKFYPGFSKVVFCSRAIFREKGFEPVEDRVKVFKSKPKNIDNDVRDDSIRRAKEKVFDIALMNNFEYFVTWTLDQRKIDRYNPQVVSKKLKQFLNNMQKRYNMKYLIIPELHRDGAIHMHGLVSGNIRLIDSGKKTGSGHKIYNMPQWKLGFSTAIPTYGDNFAIAKYITKYITKDFCKIFGNFYYAGGDIVRDAPIKLYDTVYQNVEAKEYIVPHACLAFKYLVIDNG